MGVIRARQFIPCLLYTSFGRNAQGEFVYRELTPDNAPQLNDFIALAQGGTLVLSHPCLLYTSIRTVRWVIALRENIDVSG